MSCSRLIVLSMMMALAIGCSKEEKKAPPGAPTDATTPPVVTPPSKDKTGMSAPPASTPAKSETMLAQAPAPAIAAAATDSAGSPDEAARKFFDGLANNHPIVIWEMLPASYQGDVNKLITDFAGKMDPELWNTGFKTLQKAVKVLKEKREFVLKHPLVQLFTAQVDPAILEKNWETLISLPETLVNSEISNLDNLRKPDVAKFLNGTMTQLMTKSSSLAESMGPAGPGMSNTKEFDNVKVTLVSQDGDTAKLKLEKEGQPEKEVETVKIEGKWLPKEIADQWKAKMDEARANLDKMSAEDIAKAKEQALPVFKAADKPLDAMLAATNDTEFNAALAELMEAVKPMMPPMGGPGGPPGGFDGPPGGPGGFDGPPGGLPVTPPTP